MQIYAAWNQLIEACGEGSAYLKSVERVWKNYVHKSRAIMHRSIFLDI